MELFHYLAGVVAGILTAIAFALYISETIKGPTKPSRGTWWMLTIISATLSASYFASGAIETMWVPGVSLLGCLITAIAATVYNKDKWTRLEKYCLLGTFVNLVIWYFSGDPVLATTMSLVLDLVALAPTIKKVYLEPKTENRVAWLITLFSGIANLLAVEQWTYAIAAYPIYMFLCNGTITMFIWFRPRQIAAQPQTTPLV